MFALVSASLQSRIGIPCLNHYPMSFSMLAVVSALLFRKGNWKRQIIYTLTYRNIQLMSVNNSGKKLAALLSLSGFS